MVVDRTFMQRLKNKDGRSNSMIDFDSILNGLARTGLRYLLMHRQEVSIELQGELVCLVPDSEADLKRGFIELFKLLNSLVLAEKEGDSKKMRHLRNKISDLRIDLDILFESSIIHQMAY